VLSSTQAKNAVSPAGPAVAAAARLKRCPPFNVLTWTAFPIAPFAPRAEHRAAVARALTVLLDFKPDLLLVSAGFDAYAGDPITQMSLEPEDFALFGQWLRESSLPAGAILEGGYSDKLPQLIDAFLVAWTQPTAVR